MGPDPVGWTPGPGDFAEQEAVLVAVLRRLEGVDSVLDLGCGYGRVAHLLERARLTPRRYVGVDFNGEHLAVARDKAIPGAVFYRDDVRRWEWPARFDLVIAVELLMHVPPEDVHAVAKKMRGWARRYILTCDWAEPIEVERYPHNWLHDYRSVWGPDAVEVNAGPFQRAYLIIKP